MRWYEFSVRSVNYDSYLSEYSESGRVVPAITMPQIPLEQIHIDFITELAEDNGYRTIMIYIDHFSKRVV